MHMHAAVDAKLHFKSRSHPSSQVYVLHCWQRSLSVVATFAGRRTNALASPLLRTHGARKRASTRASVDTRILVHRCRVHTFACSRRRRPTNVLAHPPRLGHAASQPARLHPCVPCRSSRAGSSCARRVAQCGSRPLAYTQTSVRHHKRPCATAAHCWQPRCT